MGAVMGKLRRTLSEHPTKVNKTALGTNCARKCLRQTLAVIPSFVVSEHNSQKHDLAVGCKGAERSRRERRLCVFVRSPGFARNSQSGNLVVFFRWSGFCHRAGGDLSSR